MKSRSVSFASRLQTVSGLLRYFFRWRRAHLAPVLLFLLVSGVILVATGGLSYVAPFVYALF